jgi:hypothetical protein
LPFARLAIETDPATQTIRYDVVDDMKAEADAALIAARREERIERLAPVAETHAAAIIGKENFNVAISDRLYLDVDGTTSAVKKCMCNRVEKEIGERLSVRSWITVHRLALDGLSPFSY